jgi:hypothetical protein
VGNPFKSLTQAAASNRRIGVAIAGALLVSGAIAYLSYGTGKQHGAAASRQIGFAKEDIDLGEQTWGSQVSATLAFQNKSDAPVTIDHVVSTCGCMLVHGAAALEGKVVERGSSLPIEVTLDTGDRPRVRSGHLQLQTQDGKQYLASVHALVVGEWTLSADIVDFGDVTLGSAHGPTQTVTFSSETDDLAAPPACRAPWVECITKRRSEEAVNVVNVVLRVDPDKLPPGLSTTALKLTTTNATVPDAWVTVRARGVTPLTPYPPHVLLKPGSSTKVRFVDGKGNLASIASIDASGLDARVVGLGIVEIRVEDSRQIETPLRLEVRDQSGQIGTVLLSTIRERKGVGS